jgi:exodeoxyribonuclease VII large subunit
MARLETSAARPAPVRQVATLMAAYVDRLGAVWVEGQIAELTRRPRTPTVWITLRDLIGEASVQVACARTVFDGVDPPVVEGAKVLVHAKFQYYLPRGSLSMRALEIRPVGLGDLLARLEQRRRLLAAEGLFDPARKRALPFLPRLVGLIAGRASAAERDVVENARRRWPGVSFRVENCPVQGPDAARHVIEALRALDHDPAVDVIVIARGGGSTEDLLPFSDEGLIRAVAAARTPVVSAIGHEADAPLVDLVADHRASTPTDAAKAIVPDVRDELAMVDGLRSRAHRVVTGLVEHESYGLASVRTRPVLAQPLRTVTLLEDQLADVVAAARRGLVERLDNATHEVGAGLASLRALSPLATLRRGYSVVQTSDGSVVTEHEAVASGDGLEILVTNGRIHAVVERTEGR